MFRIFVLRRWSVMHTLCRWDSRLGCWCHRFVFPEIPVIRVTGGNFVVQKNLRKRLIAACDGRSLAEHQACLLHKALHSMPSRALLDWASGGNAAADTRALGMEALSIRLPVASPMSHGVAARLESAFIQRRTCSTDGHYPIPGRSLWASKWRWRHGRHHHRESMGLVYLPTLAFKLMVNTW